MNTFFPDFKKRVKKIAFTDSVHSFNPARVAYPKWHWLAEVVLRSCMAHIVVRLPSCVATCVLFAYDAITTLKCVYLSQRAINWVSCNEPLDTELDHWDDGVRRFSAGG